MLDFKRLLFHEVGERVRRLREKAGFSRAELIRKMQLGSGGQTSAATNWIIDQGTIAKVERGVAEKRNRYLLSANQIRYMADVFGITPKELVWGDEVERETLVQLILLAVVADRAKTSPVYFFGEDELLEFFDWAKKQQCLGARQREIALHAAQLTEEMSKGLKLGEMKLKDGSSIIVTDAYKELSAFFASQYGLFYDEGNEQRYRLLHSENVSGSADDKRIEARQGLANTMLTSMMADLSYAVRYTNRLVNRIRSDSYKMGCYLYDGIVKLDGDKGFYADIAMDYGEYDYILFTSAFRRFWGKHKEAIMGTLDSEVFAGSLIIANGLKQAMRGIDGVEGKLIEAIVGVDGEDDRYAITKTLGENYFQQSLQFAIAAKRAETVDTVSDETVMGAYLDYTGELRNMTGELITRLETRGLLADEREE